MISSMACELKWKKDFTRKVRKFHKIVGFIAFFIGQFSILTGILMYANMSNWTDLMKAGPLNVILAFFTMIIIEISFRIWRKKETPWVKP